MKKQEENKMSMIYAVLEVCGVHTAKWSPLTAYKTAHDELVANKTSLENALQVQKQILTGVASDKGLKREAMVQKATEVANGLYAYAVDKGNEVLRMKVSMEKSTFMRQRDAVIAQMCQNVCDLGTAEVANLGPYGLVAADMTDLQTAIDTYVAVVSSPRTAVTVRKGATAEIDLLIRNSMKILNGRMDKLMPEFKTSAPDFYQAYFDARIIVDLGTGEKPAENKAA